MSVRLDLKVHRDRLARTVHRVRKATLGQKDRKGHRGCRAIPDCRERKASKATLGYRVRRVTSVL